MSFKQKLIKFLRWTEQYTKTDMVYLAKGGFWHILDRSLTFLIGFATMSALSRWLTKETFGAYQYVLSITAILGLSTLPGMGQAITRAVSRKKEKEFKKAIKEKSKWSLLGIAVCLIISFWYLWQGNSMLGYSFLMTSFLFPIPRIATHSGFWTGRKRFDINAKLNVGINFLEALVFLPILYFFNNLIVILSAYFASRIIFRSTACVISLKSISNDKEDDETLPFGKHLTTIKAATTVADRIDKILVWQFLGPVQVAIYSFAKLPIDKLKSLLPISILALPKLSEKNEVQASKLLKKFFKSFLFSIPIAGLAFLAPSAPELPLRQRP